MIAIAAALVLVGAGPMAAADDAPPERTVEQQLADALAERPGGTIVGNRLEYPDGSGIIAYEGDVMSIADCSSGWFCTWPRTGFRGTLSYRSGTGTKSLTADVLSFWNNRSNVARLYNNAGTASKCHEDGVAKSSVGSNYQNSPKVGLSSSASC